MVSSCRSEVPSFQVRIFCKFLRADLFRGEWSFQRFHQAFREGSFQCFHLFLYFVCLVLAPLQVVQGSTGSFLSPIPPALGWRSRFCFTNDFSGRLVRFFSPSERLVFGLWPAFGKPCHSNAFLFFFTHVFTVVAARGAGDSLKS